MQKHHTQGILPAQDLRELIRSMAIHCPTASIPPENLQPASLDLRLGQKAYRVRTSFLPGNQPVEKALDDVIIDTLPLEDWAILEANRPYIIPLEEHLRLPQDVHARSNPRSSTGRLDIFTRVITDHGEAFDDIPAGYQGPLHLEVVPRSFTLRARAGDSLNQIRLSRGHTPITGSRLFDRHRQDPLVLVDGRPRDLNAQDMQSGISLTVDLMGRDTGGTVGYRVRRNSRLIDLSLRETLDPDEFWQPVQAQSDGQLILEPEEFYLLTSRESLRIPPDMAAEMLALDHRAGEFRTHYAGFFDPGFGYGQGAESTRAVLEVRAHEVPFLLRHGQHICRLQFELTRETPDVLYGRQIGSSYQGQGLQLSKHFRRA